MCLKEFLSMPWDAALRSDYMFKSNVIKHVIQLEGTEIGGPEGSMLLVYYNLYTGTPMVAVWHVDGEVNEESEVIDGFRGVKEIHESGTENAYTETVYIEDSIGAALA